MATKEMIEKLRMEKKVYPDNQGRLPKHYLEWLENAVADHFYFNCNYCKKRERCDNFPNFDDCTCKDWSFDGGGK